MGWSGTGKLFARIDSPTKTVKKYDYDVKTKQVSNGRILIDLTDGGTPDGLCVDPCDDIWVAEYRRAVVSASGTPKRARRIFEIPMPATNVTSCCIGGQDSNYLYITTARRPRR
ncbi:MAG: SMP-30/gluconolactonase/LRE family protein [Alkalibacterium sp.]|nr:SMP-30/gluconolactonase/LRE family protein [Alkalibacterium sp.]